jgi:PhzF family phenazine biosynthesis protein
MELEMFIVDAFTQEKFQGNSAAVIPLKEWIEPQLMQKIAAENNLSESAFFVTLAPNKFEIRWFSPLTEIDFCGHATLASAHVIFHHLGFKGDIEFQTREVGSLLVKQLVDGRIEMSFPNQSPEPVDEVPQALINGLSIKPVTVLKNRQAYFAVMSTEQEVQNVNYQSDQLKQLAPLDVVVTAQSADCDFISRYFWPANGGDEDPVTGSIHAGLAPYWAKQLNKSNLIAYQASKRGGMLFCEVIEDRVLVSGFAVLYLRGTAYV